MKRLRIKLKELETRLKPKKKIISIDEFYKQVNDPKSDLYREWHLENYGVLPDEKTNQSET